MKKKARYIGSTALPVCSGAYGLLVFLLLLPSVTAVAQEAETEEQISTDVPSGLTAVSIAREIVQASSSRHAYDWRKLSYEVYVGYGYADEANSFDTESYELGLALPQSTGLSYQLALRRSLVYSTPSTNSLGGTPYLQEALTSRFELSGGLAYSLLEGRAITRLSPWLPDVEHLLAGVARVHFAKAAQNHNPLNLKKPQTKLGQKPVQSRYGVELGLRTQIYSLLDLGIYFETLYVLPLNGGQYLKSWTQFSGGLIWAVP